MKWAIISTKGYKYKDKLGVQDGVTKIIVKGSSNNKSKALVKGKGAALPDVVPPLALPVTAVLVNSDTGDCFTSSFDAPDIKKNIGGLFKAVAQ